MIVGASAGAWNGWLIAAGATPDELAHEWLDASSGRVLQRGSRPAALYETARDIFTRWSPTLPFGLTVTEVPRMRPVLFRSPSINWKHLAATASIPIFFPPVEIDGKRYVDGGLLGALPVWAAQEMGATRAIALNAWPYRILRPILKPLMPRATIETVLIEPSEPLGSLRDAAVWSPINITRWIALGERDGNRAAGSITI